jgi:hypothetical protein
MDEGTLPKGLIECVHYVMAFAALRKYFPKSDWPHTEYALDAIEGCLARWRDCQCSPIKGADAAVKALAEACVRDRKIARLKAELAKLEEM